MAGTTIIGTYYDALHDELLRLGEERDQAEKEDLHMRKMRRQHLSLYDVATGICAAATVFFGMRNRTDSTVEQMITLGSLVLGVCTYVTGRFEKMGFDNKPTSAYERARLLDLAIYDMTIHEKSFFGEEGIYKYPETPEKWSYMKIKGLTIKP